MANSKYALHGSIWNSGVKVMTILATGAKIFVLAHLLTPTDFGLFQYVIILQGLLESITETGINTTIVQSQKHITYFLDTAWVISIIRGFVISILMIAASFFMSGYFHEDRLVPLIALASFGPLIKGFINPYNVTLYKGLRFFHDSVYKFSLVAVDALAAIVFVLFFHSMYVMVLCMLVAAVFEVAISFLFFSTRPKFHAVSSRIKEILDNMKGLSIGTIVGYMVENFDNLLVGKIVGTEALGIYSNAYALSHKFNLQFAKSVQYGTFPVYVTMQEDRNKLLKAFLWTVFLSLGVFLLVSMPFLLFPAFVVHFFLGDQWGGVIPILRPLVVAGLIQSFIAISQTLFVSVKKYAWVNATTLVNIVGLVGLIVVLGQSGGLMGCVLGVLISRAVVLPIAIAGVWQTFTSRAPSNSKPKHVLP